jgi:hypothetical protein
MVKNLNLYGFYDKSLVVYFFAFELNIDVWEFPRRMFS